MIFVHVYLHLNPSSFGLGDTSIIKSGTKTSTLQFLISAYRRIEKEHVRTKRFRLSAITVYRELRFLSKWYLIDLILNHMRKDEINPSVDLG
jgi:hypothetical protein